MKNTSLVNTTSMIALVAAFSTAASATIIDDNYIGSLDQAGVTASAIIRPIALPIALSAATHLKFITWTCL